MTPTGLSQISGWACPDLNVANAQRVYSNSSAILASNGPPLDVSAYRAIYLLKSGTLLPVPARRGF
ncbi:hypothetical protein CN191_02215 [Sinorhizobium meliloti]|nr:hypothetical protein CN191_02215 [Sinorhizobium meliloti]